MDGIMILTFLAIIFSRFRERVGPAQGRYHFVSHMVGILYSSACEPEARSEKRGLEAEVLVLFLVLCYSYFHAYQHQ
jgi:hypothetical protein